MKISHKVAVGASLVWALVLGVALDAFAQTAADPVSLATDAGTDMRDTAIAVIAALIPLAVALLLAKKALPWARKFLHV